LDTADKAHAHLDFIGIGFGPSNLALTIAAQECAPQLKGLFFEKNREFSWHSGILFDHSRMQISFLKDLVTLRNPTSRYSFLEYTRCKQRLERFVNLGEFHPTRIEYQDYLRWVAGHFQAQVRYGSRVLAVVPRFDGPRPHYEVTVEAQDTGVRSTYRATNVIVGTGGTPRPLEGVSPSDPRVVHSSRFLPGFRERFPDRNTSAAFAIVGGGQSGAEIAIELLRDYPRARVHLLVAGYSLRAVDRSPFVNEVFSFGELEAFFESEPERKAAILDELRATNYGVVDPDLLDELYRHVYLAEVKGERRLAVHAFSRVIGAENAPEGEGLLLKVEDRVSGEVSPLPCDGVVLATGYERRLDPEIFAAVQPLLKCDDAGNPRLSRAYRAEIAGPSHCGFYLQGQGETSHGIGDTLLSQLPFRSERIVEDLRASAHASRASADYPPARHVEDDRDALYAFIQQHPFATLISARAQDDPVATQIPLILDRERGANGVLFGHVDRSNPHAEILDGRPIMAIFHGPHGYISPLVYRTRQLPTWNSMSVHLWGCVRLLEDKPAVVRGLQSICERADPDPGSFRLEAQDPRIEALIDGIVAFEIDIERMVGRFKLSQDRDIEDRRLAAQSLMRNAPPQDRTTIETALHSICPVVSERMTPTRPANRDEAPCAARRQE